METQSEIKKWQNLADIKVCLVPIGSQLIRFTVMSSKNKEQLEQWLSSALDQKILIDTCMSALDLIQLGMLSAGQKGWFISSGNNQDVFVLGELQSALKTFEEQNKEPPLSWCPSELLDNLLTELQDDMKTENILVDPEPSPLINSK